MSHYLCGKLIYSSTHHDYNLRDIHEFRIDFCKTIKRHNILFYKRLIIFNALPVSIKESRNVLLFKKALRKHWQEFTSNQ